ncbi:serine/threonine-protein phosphatase 6 regulatory ankyrin repeat subunit C-like [Stylophora pistillata]|nr:serine/threonine-protein phosphatase 6 regulatory ankyrin repeat subunit C-like [Stylophora pistillata]
MIFQKTGNQANVFPGKTALEILFALQEKGEGNFEKEKKYKEYVEKIDTLNELHLCRGSDDAEKAVEIFLNDGVEIDIPAKSNRTPLMWANTSSSGKFIKTLIDIGADVNAQRPDDNVTPLIVVAHFNNYGATNILLNHGAQVNIEDNFGEQPLHDGAKEGFFNVSKRLIDS